MIENIEESWKDISGYEGKYQISTHGRVRSLTRFVSTKGNSVRRVKGRILKTFMDSGDYKRIPLLATKRTYKKFLIHRLVSLAFLRPVPNKNIVNHIDGNKLNNHYSNLEWCSLQENMDHAVKNGLIRSGERHPNAKLNHSQVARIREYINNKTFSESNLARQFNVAVNTINRLKKNGTWREK